MSDAAEYLRTVVRVFPDHAGTVLWFAPGSVSYEESHLTKELVAEMLEWEASYYANLTELFQWRAGTDLAAFDNEGLRLAERLAGELGDVIEVDYLNHREDSPRFVRVRGVGDGTNAVARSAFAKMAHDAQREDEKTTQTPPDGEVRLRFGPRWPG